MARLALVMIARDEARCIARALESVRPHVDRMVVLDTGSTDATPEIASGLGAEVGRFDWCDDFAAARNAALEMADADWVLMLDADEWLEGAAAALGPQTLLASPAAPFLGLARVRSEIAPADGEAGVAASWIARVLPRGVRYAGRIHEQPVSTLPQRRLALAIGHDGYLPDALARKAGRNEALLRREIAEAPGDAYLWLQLGRELQVRGRAAEAADAFARACELCPPNAPYRHGLVVRAIPAFKTAERFDEAMALADAELPRWQASPDFFFVVGDLYLEWASRNPDRAIKDFLPIVEYAWKKCLEIGERDDLDGSVKGRGGFMAAYNLAIMFETFGLDQQAGEYQALAERLRPAA